MVACELLLSFDPTFTIKHRFLSSKQQKIYNQVVRPIRHALLSSYVMGFVARAIAFFGPASNGKWLAPAAFALQIPHIINVMLMFRYDYVLILTRSFDFWFLAVSVAVWFVCFSLAFQDNRVWALPSCCLDFVNAFLVESFFRSPLAVLIAALSSIVFFIAVIVELLLGHIDDLKNVRLISSHNHALTTRDLLFNSMGTIMMLLCRLAYTTYNIVRLRRGEESKLCEQSNGYRCRIKLQLLQAKQNAGAESDRPQFDIMGKMDKTIRLVSMKLAHQWTDPIDSAQTLVPWVSSLQLYPLLIWTMNMIGVIGFVSTLAVLFPIFLRNETTKSVAAYVGLAFTFAFYVWFACNSQKQLLRKLVSSFYFLFLFAQISAAHLCACDMNYWDAASSQGFLSSWLWTQCVLMSDTICPITRDKIRFRFTSLPVALLWVLEVVHLIVVCEVLVQNRWKLQDRIICSMRLLAIRLISVSCRSCFLVKSRFSCGRVACCGGFGIGTSDELLLLQGRVEFRRTTRRKAVPQGSYEQLRNTGPRKDLSYPH